MWSQILIGLVGLASTVITYWLKSKSTKEQNKQLEFQSKQYQILLERYATVIKERNALREEVGKLNELLYEGYSVDDLIAVANRLPKLDSGDSN